MNPSRSIGPLDKKQEEDMRDELFDRDYQEGREALNDGIDRLLGHFMDGFRTLTAIQFAAPWKHRTGQSGEPTGLA